MIQVTFKEEDAGWEGQITEVPNEDWAFCLRECPLEAIHGALVNALFHYRWDTKAGKNIGEPLYDGPPVAAFTIGTPPAPPPAPSWWARAPGYETDAAP